MKMAENMNQTQTQTIMTKSGKILDPQQMHVCRLCDKLLSSSSSLDRHMLTHSGERPFVCKRCHMTFTTNGNMHRHMRTHLHKDSLARQQQEQMQLKQSLLVGGAGGGGNSSGQLLGRTSDSANSNAATTAGAFSYSPAIQTTNPTATAAATSQHNQMTANQRFGQHHHQQPSLTNNPLASLIASNINAAQHQNHQNPVTALLNQQLLAAAFQQQQQQQQKPSTKRSVHANNQEVSTTTFHQNHQDISKNQLHTNHLSQQQRQTLLAANQMMQTTPMDQQQHHHLDPKALMMSAAAQLAAANQNAGGAQSHQASLESMKTMMLAAAAAAAATAAAAAMNQQQQQQQQGQESSELLTGASNFSQDLLMELPNSHALGRASPAPNKARGKRRKQVNPLRSSGQLSATTPTREHVGGVSASNCSSSSSNSCSSSSSSSSLSPLNGAGEVGQMDDASASPSSSSGGGGVDLITVKLGHNSSPKREDFNNNEQSARSSPNTSKVAVGAVKSERENKPEEGREIDDEFDRVEMAPSEVDYEEEKLYDAGDDDDDDEDDEDEQRRQANATSDKDAKRNVRLIGSKEKFHSLARDADEMQRERRRSDGERDCSQQQQQQRQQVNTATDARSRSDHKGAEGPLLGEFAEADSDRRRRGLTALSENEFSEDEDKFGEGVALNDIAGRESDDRSQHSDSDDAMSEDSESGCGRVRKKRRRDFDKISSFDNSSSCSSTSRELKQSSHHHHHHHQIAHKNSNNLEDLASGQLVDPIGQISSSLFGSNCTGLNNNLNELNIVTSNQDVDHQDQRQQFEPMTGDDLIMNDDGDRVNHNVQFRQNLPMTHLSELDQTELGNDQDEGDDEDGEVVEDVSQSYVKTANPNATRKGGKRNRHCYKCKLCTYSSVDRCTLVRHLRIHSGERPYICGICRYAFTTKANCERHVRKRHKKQYNSLGGSGGVKGSNGGGRSLIITDHSNHQTIPVKVNPVAAQTISQTLQRIQEKEQQQQQQQQQHSAYENVGPNRLDGGNQHRAHESDNIERIGDRGARAMSDGSTRSPSGNKRRHRQINDHSMTADGELSSSVHRSRRLPSKLHKSAMNNQRPHQAPNFSLTGPPRPAKDLFSVCDSDPLLSAAGLGKQPDDLFLDQVQMQAVANNYMSGAAAGATKTSSNGEETGADLTNNNQTSELFVNLLAQIRRQMTNGNNNLATPQPTGFTMQPNPALATQTTLQCGESTGASVANANFLANLLAAGGATMGSTPQGQPTALIEQLNSLLSSKHLSQQLRNLNIQNPFFNRRNPFDSFSSIDIAQALDLSCKLQTHK